MAGWKGLDEEAPTRLLARGWQHESWKTTPEVRH